METTIVISKEKYITLKEELKSLAEEIRTAKSAHKEAQRKNDSPWVVLANLTALKFQARYKLIAYALIKGRSYEQIENHTREFNKPDWKVIKGIQDECSN